MKYFFLIISSLFLTVNVFANNPISSPTFDDILKDVLGEQKYIFDDKNIELSVPNFADNATQVPIFVDAKKIKNAKRVVLFADLNPIPKIIDMKLINLLPLVSLNIKVAQETPIRALVLDENNLWHIASKNIKSFGGGCDVSSQASNSDSEFAKYLGQTKSNLFTKDNVNRLKASIFHPMETGLIFGNNAFYITRILVKNGNDILSEIITYSAISENPRFTFETKEKGENYSIEFYDNDGNEFISKAK